jgi:hypothetical protein
MALRSHPLFFAIDLAQAGGKFVIVDPFDPSNILYLTPKAYDRRSIVAMSNEESLTVLLRPGEQVLAGSNGLPLRLKDDPSPSDSSTTPSLRKFFVSARAISRIYRGFFRRWSGTDPFHSPEWFGILSWIVAVGIFWLHLYFES